MIKESNVLAIQRLASFQRRFIEQFVGGRGFYVLDWPTGAGKTTTAIHIIEWILKAKPSARVLVIVGHKVLQQFLSERLASGGVNVKSIDRYEYRLMQDSAVEGEAMWERGITYLLAENFAMEDDIVASVGATDWDLLVTVEANGVFAQKSLLAERIASSSPNLRVLVESRGETPLRSIGGNPWNIVSLRREDLNDPSGPASVRIEPTVEIVNIEPTPTEAGLTKTAAAIIEALKSFGPDADAVAQDFAARLDSSPVAFEEAARRLRNVIAHGLAPWSFSEPNAKDAERGNHLGSGGVHDANLFAALTDYLLQIEYLEIDSKIAGLKSEIGKEMRAGRRHICIYSSYASSLLYVKAALDEESISAYLILESQAQNEREQAIEGFYQQGGILLGATPMLMEGVDLVFVDTLVLYDLPRTAGLLNQLYGRFQRIGRAKPLRLIAFDSEKFVAARNERVLGRIEEMIQDEA